MKETSVASLLIRRAQRDNLLGNYHQAITALDEAIQITPGSTPLAYLVKSTVFEKQKNFISSINTLQYLIDHFSGSVEAMIASGLLSTPKDIKSPREYYDEAIEKDPTCVIAFFYRGVNSYNLGQYDEAITDFSTCINLDPGFLEAYLERSEAYENLQQFTPAIEDLILFSIKIKRIEQWVMDLIARYFVKLKTS